MLAERTRVVAVRWVDHSIEIDTTSSRIRTQLLIDCTGGSSPIASTFRLHKLAGFFTVYAQHRTRLAFDPHVLVAAQISQLGYPPVFFELMPTGPASAFCIAFTATRRARSFDELQAAVEDHLVRKEFVAAEAGSEITHHSRGVIPVGRVRRRLPGITSFGEAAMLQPPLLGTAFNEVLEHAHDVVRQILKALKQGRTRTFQPRYPLTKRFNDRLQWWFAKRLIDASAEEVDYLVRVCARLAPATLFALYSNELRPAQWIPAAGAIARAAASEPRRV